MAKLWKSPSKVSSWRKISVGMWRPPSDPTIYGYETVDVEELMQYLDEISEASGSKVTLTAYLVKITSDIFAHYPELNSIVIKNRVMRRENVDAFCQVAVATETGASADLSGVKLRNSERMTLPEIADRLHRRADKVRKGQDKEIEQTKSMIDKIPPLLLPTLMRVVDVLTYVVPVDLGKLGIRDDPFGSFMVTNCAPFDIKLGFAPLVPASRTPVVILPGIIEDHIFVEEGKPVVKKGCQISFTADHRCFDGLQVGILVREIRARLLSPRDYYPDPKSLRTEAAPAQKKAKAAKAQSASRTPETAKTVKTAG